MLVGTVESKVKKFCECCLQLLQAVDDVGWREIERLEFDS